MGTLRQLFLGDLADDGRERGERRREKIMPSLMATSLRWRTHSARTNYGLNDDEEKPLITVVSIPENMILKYLLQCSIPLHSVRIYHKTIQ